MFLRRNDHPQIPPPFPKVVRNVFFFLSRDLVGWCFVETSMDFWRTFIYYYVQVSFLSVLMLWISYRLKRHQDTSSLTVPTIGYKTFVIPSCQNWCWTMGWTLEKRDVVGFGIAGTKIQHWQLGKMTPFWLVSEHLKQICPVIWALLWAPYKNP